MPSRLAHAASLLALVLAAGASAAPPAVTDASDKVILEKFLAHARTQAKAITAESVAKVKEPEMLCWVEMPQLSLSMTAYELTGDVAHLRDFAAGAEVLYAALQKDPDGRLGWIGSPIPPLKDPANPDAKVCEIQADFRAIGMYARFAELVAADPALAKEFGDLRTKYLALLEDNLYPRWEPSFADLGEKGGVYRWNKAYHPTKRELTLAHEKQAIMIESLLNLHRATGKEVYLKRAVALGTFLKSGLTLKDDAYSWRYWDPAGDWDYTGEGDAKKPRHWLGAEPKGQWHAATVGSAAILYHHGVVFDRTDMARFAKTQTTISWNGDLEKPVYLTTVGKPPPEQFKSERFIAPSLAPFDARIEQFVTTGGYQKERLDKADKPWEGGMINGGYLHTKYLLLPKAKGGAAIYAKPAKP